MERNTELLQQTMQYIINHPDQHDQADWAVQHDCGTTACFAGWAAILSGWTVKQVQLTDDPVKDIGGEILGLTVSESHQLFDASNTRHQLELMVKDLVNGVDILHPYYDE